MLFLRYLLPPVSHLSLQFQSVAFQEQSHKHCCVFLCCELHTQSIICVVLLCQQGHKVGKL